MVAIPSATTAAPRRPETRRPWTRCGPRTAQPVLAIAVAHTFTLPLARQMEVADGQILRIGPVASVTGLALARTTLVIALACVLGRRVVASRL